MYPYDSMLMTCHKSTPLKMIISWLTKTWCMFTGLKMHVTDFIFLAQKPSLYQVKSSSWHLKRRKQMVSYFTPFHCQQRCRKKVIRKKNSKISPAPTLPNTNITGTTFYQRNSPYKNHCNLISPGIQIGQFYTS